MKRRIFKLVLFLLLGATINVAVAWAISLRPLNAIDEVIRSNWTLSDGQWSGSRWEGIGEQFVFVSRVWVSPHIAYSKDHIDVATIEQVIPAWTQLRDASFVFPRRGVSQTHIADALGWPFLSMYSEYHEFDGPPPNLQIKGGIPWSTWVHGSQAELLPLIPIWPGFAINTIFYAAIVWLLFAAPFALRRRRRIKRGLCPACAYPVGDSPVCTECGAAITMRDSRKPTAESPP